MEVAVMGGGCFWCVEALLQRLKGVIRTCPGYCGGEGENPSYKQVKTGKTGHVEVVKVQFDSKILSLETLLTVFMNIHDPSQADGQGEDIGSQYISVIFYQNSDQRKIASQVLELRANELRKEGRELKTKLLEAQNFYAAQIEHQNYFNLKGDSNPYCQIIPPKIAKMKGLFAPLCSE